MGLGLGQTEIETEIETWTETATETSMYEQNSLGSVCPVGAGGYMYMYMYIYIHIVLQLHTFVAPICFSTAPNLSSSTLVWLHIYACPNRCTSTFPGSQFVLAAEYLELAILGVIHTWSLTYGGLKNIGRCGACSERSPSPRLIHPLNLDSRACGLFRLARAWK